MDLIIRNAQIATDGVEYTADVAVLGGVIRAVGDLSTLNAREVVDGTGCLLIPGLVDLGVNLLEDGFFDPESRAGFTLTTRDAALGGVTTIISAIEVEPGESPAEAIRAQQEADSRKAAVDFGYHLIVRQCDAGTAGRVRDSINAGVCSFWAARNPLESAQPGNALLMNLAAALPDESLLVATPWDPILMPLLIEGAKAAEAGFDAGWQQAYPRALEAAHIHQLAAVLGKMRGKAMLLGVSSLEALVALEQVRQQLPNLQAAASISSLFFLEAETGAPRTWPPIREKADQQALFTALEQGLVSTVVSLHKPRTAAETIGTSKAALPPIGLATLGHMLPILYAEGIAKWRLTMTSLTQACCADAAKLAGLYPRKGTIQPGADADLVLLDPTAKRTVEVDSSQSGPLDCINPLSEAELHGQVRQVWLRGRLIAQGGRLVEDAAGKYLSRRMALK